MNNLDVRSRVFPTLPNLNDAHPTVRSWVEVEEDGLVVLSVPATAFLLRLGDATLQEVDLEGFLGSIFERVSTMLQDDFDNLLNFTPFRSYRSTNPGGFVTKNNKLKYVIMTTTYWGEVLNQILKEFVPVVFNVNAEVPANAMMN